MAFLLLCNQFPQSKWNNLLPEDYIQVFSTLDPDIDTLDFSSCNLGCKNPLDIIKIFQAIPKQIRIINLEGTALPSLQDNLANVFAAFPEWIENIKLGGNYFDELKSLEALTAALPKLPKAARILDLTNLLRPLPGYGEYLATLFAAIPPQIEDVYFSEMIGENSSPLLNVQDYEKFLAKLPASVKYLNLSKNKLGKIYPSVLPAGLASLPTGLKTLNITANDFTDHVFTFVDSLMSLPDTVEILVVDKDIFTRLPKSCYARLMALLHTKFKRVFFEDLTTAENVIPILHEVLVENQALSIDVFGMVLDYMDDKPAEYVPNKWQDAIRNFSVEVYSTPYSMLKEWLDNNHNPELKGFEEKIKEFLAQIEQEQLRQNPKLQLGLYYLLEYLALNENKHFRLPVIEHHIADVFPKCGSHYEAFGKLFANFRTLSKGYFPSTPANSVQGLIDAVKTTPKSISTLEIEALETTHNHDINAIAAVLPFLPTHVTELDFHFYQQPFNVLLKSIPLHVRSLKIKLPSLCGASYLKDLKAISGSVRQVRLEYSYSSNESGFERNLHFTNLLLSLNELPDSIESLQFKHYIELSTSQKAWLTTIIKDKYKNINISGTVYQDSEKPIDLTKYCPELPFKGKAKAVIDKKFANLCKFGHDLINKGENPREIYLAVALTEEFLNGNIPQDTYNFLTKRWLKSNHLWRLGQMMLTISALAGLALASAVGLGVSAMVLGTTAVALGAGLGSIQFFSNKENALYRSTQDIAGNKLAYHLINKVGP